MRIANFNSMGRVNITILKVVVSGVLAIPGTILLLMGSLFLHLKIYKGIYPERDTEWGHNLYFDQQVEIHLMVAVPLFYIGLFVLGLFLLNKWSAMKSDRNIGK